MTAAKRGLKKCASGVFFVNLGTSVRLAGVFIGQPACYYIGTEIKEKPSFRRKSMIFISVVDANRVVKKEVKHEEGIFYNRRDESLLRYRGSEERVKGEAHQGT